MTAVSPSPSRHAFLKLLPLLVFPALIFFFGGLPTPELYLRALAAAMLGTALWILECWPSPAGQPRLYKTCFMLFQGFWFGTFMALCMSQQDNRASALIHLGVGLLCYGGLMLAFSKKVAGQPPIAANRLPRILFQLLLGILATALMMASGAPVSASGVVAAGVLFALPVPSDRQLPRGETRLRFALFLLLLIGAIAVMLLY